jgi:hypothetical protein
MEKIVTHGQPIRGHVFAIHFRGMVLSEAATVSFPFFFPQRGRHQETFFFVLCRVTATCKLIHYCFTAQFVGKKAIAEHG